MVRELIILKVANTFASLASGKEQALEGRGAPVGLGRNFLCSCFGVVDNRVSNML